MPTILVNMSTRSYERVVDTETEARLRALGEVHMALDPQQFDEEACRRLWTTCDYAITGWGLRPPRLEWFPPTLRLKAICHAAGTVRMIPRALIERGVIVTSARAAIARTVAEFTLACALTMLRHLASYDTRTVGCLDRLGASHRPDTRTLYGRTVVLVGLGHVGRHFRDLLKPFGARVIAVDPFVSAEAAKSLDVELMDLRDALPLADVVSLHAPSIPETRQMIGATELALLRDGALLINTARGSLIDTEALTKELASGRIYAALDVTDPEPLPDNHPLAAMPNVLLTPHVAGPTTDELPRLGQMAVADLEAIMGGRQPTWPVDLKAYDRMSF